MKLTKVVYFAVIIFLAANFNAFPQWTQISSGTENNLNSVFSLDENTSFIAGDAGTILKSTDGGANWHPLVTGITDNLNGIAFTSSSIGVAVGDGGKILRTTDGGSSWSSIPSGIVDYQLFSVAFNGATGVIGGSSQTILYSTDSGASWDTSQTDMWAGGFWGAQMFSSTTGLLAGQNSINQGYLAKTTNGGVNWSFNNFYFNSNEGLATNLYFFDENNGIVTGRLWDFTGAILNTTNGGTGWTASTFADPINDVDGLAGGIAYAVGGTGTILKTTTSGSEWTTQTSGTSNTLKAVDFINEQKGIAVGEMGIILVANNGTPVELTSFTAAANNNNVNLSWSTATETNNKGFQIERKSSGSFETISFVNGKGTTTEKQLYNYSDKELAPGKYTYRLKQIDFDGTFAYSKEVEVDMSMPKAFSLEQNYPNPFNPATTIKFSLPSDSRVTLKVYNNIGQEVATLVNGTLPAGNREISFNASSLSSGVYFYKIEATGINNAAFSSVKKMILMK